MLKSMCTVFAACAYYVYTFITLSLSGLYKLKTVARNHKARVHSRVGTRERIACGKRGGTRLGHKTTREQLAGCSRVFLTFSWTVLYVRMYSIYACVCCVKWMGEWMD